MTEIFNILVNNPAGPLKVGGYPRGSLWEEPFSSQKQKYWNLVYTLRMQDPPLGLDYNSDIPVGV